VCRVVHEGRVSEPIPVWTGVRQGCILSPIMFLIVIVFLWNTSDGDTQYVNPSLTYL